MFYTQRLKRVLFFVLMIGVGCSSSRESLFIPANFSVPQSQLRGNVIIEPLTTAHAEMDYDAVMASRHELRAYFDGEWPSNEFKLEDNIKDLATHDKLAQLRESFAYTVLSEDRTRVVGCIYINPTDSSGFDAQVHSWLRTGEQGIDFDTVVNEWIKAEWPFKNVLYW